MSRKYITYEEACDVFGKDNVLPIGTKILCDKIKGYIIKYCIYSNNYEYLVYIANCDANEEIYYYRSNFKII